MIQQSIRSIGMLFLTIFLGIQLSHAGIEPYLGGTYSLKSATASGFDLTKLTAQDPQLAVSATGIKASKAKGILRLNLQHAALATVNAFTLDVTINYTTTGLNGTSTSTTSKTHHLDYNKTSGVSQDISQVVVADARKITVSSIGVPSCTVNGAAVTTLPDYIEFNTEVEVERYYPFNYTAIPYQGDATLMGHTVTNSELEIYWTPLDGAEYYDLEYTYVDDYDANLSSNPTLDYTIRKAASALGYDFEHNSTRISLAEHHYRFPVLYDRGYILYRVRGVGRTGTNYDKEVAGQWSLSDLTSTTVALFTHKVSLPVTGATADKNITLENINRQHSVLFAEEGKRKDAISYYDGSLRNRQSQSKNNSTGELVIGETYYDHIGRGAVQVLPVPITPSASAYQSFQFVPKFNINTSDNAYSKVDFDVSPSITQPCAISVGELKNTKGASQYYSANNPIKTGENAHIPDAENYPLIQTEYEPDNTGRIRRQGGVGKNHQLDSGHETKNLYGQPEQVELDRVLGSDAGLFSHYKKNVVQDANGQLSVSYLNESGKVVITALAGKGTGLTDLSSEGSKAITVSPINGSTYGNKDNPNRLEGNKLIYSKEFVVASAGDYTVNYSTQSALADFQCTATSTQLCNQCEYDVVVKVIDHCGNPVTPKTGSSTIAVHVGNVNNTSCTPSSAPTPNIGAAYNLPLGTYTLQKVLELRTSAVETYADRIANTCLPDTNGWFQEEQYKLIASGFICNTAPTDCKGCKEQVKNNFDRYKTAYTYLYGTATPSDAVLKDNFGYDKFLDECNSNCGAIDPCLASYEMILSDVSPNGQYGATSPDSAGFNVSVFNYQNNLARNGAYFRTIHTYKDENGEQAYVPVTPLVNDPRKPTDFKPAIDRELTDNGFTDFSGILFYGIKGADVDNGAERTDGSYQYVTPVTSFDIDEYNDKIEQGFDLLVKPEGLLGIKEFSQYFQRSWANALAYLHPEYCYYESCRADATTYKASTLGGYSTVDFDERLQIVTTWDEAVNIQAEGSGLYDAKFPNKLIDAGDAALTTGAEIATTTDFLLNADPYFMNGNNDDLKTQLEAQLTNYTDDIRVYAPINPATSKPLSLRQFVALTNRCPTRYHDPTAGSDGSCTKFGTDIGTLTAAENTKLKNDEWEMYSSLYLSLKQKLQLQKADKSCASKNSYNGGINGCIGNASYNPYITVTRSYFINSFWNSWFGVNGDRYTYTTREPDYNPSQPCGFSTYQAFRNKTKRFTSSEDEQQLIGQCDAADPLKQLQELKTKAELEYFLKTGQDGVSRDVEAFLNDIASRGWLVTNQPAKDLKSVKSFSSILYDYIKYGVEKPLDYVETTTPFVPVLLTTANTSASMTATFDNSTYNIVLNKNTADQTKIYNYRYAPLPSSISYFDIPVQLNSITRLEAKNNEGVGTGVYRNFSSKITGFKNLYYISKTNGKYLFIITAIITLRDETAGKDIATQYIDIRGESTLPLNQKDFSQVCIATETTQSLLHLLGAIAGNADLNTMAKANSSDRTVKLNDNRAGDKRFYTADFSKELEHYLNTQNGGSSYATDWFFSSVIDGVNKYKATVDFKTSATATPKMTVLLEAENYPSNFDLKDLYGLSCFRKSDVSNVFYGTGYYMTTKADGTYNKVQYVDIKITVSTPNTYQATVCGPPVPKECTSDAHVNKTSLVTCLQEIVSANAVTIGTGNTALVNNTKVSLDNNLAFQTKLRTQLGLIDIYDLKIATSTITTATGNLPKLTGELIAYTDVDNRVEGTTTSISKGKITLEFTEIVSGIDFSKITGFADLKIDYSKVSQGKQYAFTIKALYNVGATPTTTLLNGTSPFELADCYLGATSGCITMGGNGTTTTTTPPVSLTNGSLDNTTVNDQGNINTSTPGKFGQFYTDYQFLSTKPDGLLNDGTTLCGDPNWLICLQEGLVSFVTNARTVHKDFYADLKDHTSGTGYYLVYNSKAYSGTNKWRALYTYAQLQAGKTYKLTFWASNICQPCENNTAKSGVIKAEITQKGTATPITPSAYSTLVTKTWAKTEVTFTSTYTGEAEIALTGVKADFSAVVDDGYDFGLDDVSFEEVGGSTAGSGGGSNTGGNTTASSSLIDFEKSPNYSIASEGLGTEYEPLSVYPEGQHCPANEVCLTEGYARPVHSAIDTHKGFIDTPDHTKTATGEVGTGHYMAFNPNNYAPNAKAVTKTLNLTKDVAYSFSFYALNICANCASSGNGRRAALHLEVRASDGTLLSEKYSSKLDETWTKTELLYTPTASQTVTVSITAVNPSTDAFGVSTYSAIENDGYDFGLDDMYFGPSNGGGTAGTGILNCYQTKPDLLPEYPEDEVDACEEQLNNIAYNNVLQRLDNLRITRSEAKTNYVSKCMARITESLSYTYQNNEHHYTLYYYDQAGNLVKTVPPAGVQVLDVVLDANKLKRIAADRNSSGTYTLSAQPQHTMATTYYYNSLNQLVAQSMPDNEQVNLWSQRGTTGITTGHTPSLSQFTSIGQGYLITNGTNQSYIYNYQATPAAATDEWVLNSTSIKTKDLNKVRYVGTSTTAYAVGNKGVVLYTTDNGVNWKPIGIGTTKDLVEVYSIDANTTVAFAADGTAWTRTSTTWTESDGLEILMNSQEKLQSVSGNGSTVYAVTTDGTRGYIYKGTYASGWTWAEQTYSPGTLTAISNGYAAGNNGILVGIDANNNWTEVKSGETGNIQSLYKGTTNNVAIIGGVLKIKTTTNAWTGVTLPNSGSTANFTALSAQGNTLYALAKDPSNAYRLYSSANEGTDWAPESVNGLTTALGSSTIKEFYFTSADKKNALVLLADGAIRTTGSYDANPATNVSWSTSLGGITDISFIDNTNGYALGTGAIYKINTSPSLSITNTNSITLPSTITAIHINSINQGYAIGGEEIYQLSATAGVWSATKKNIVPLPLKSVASTSTNHLAVGNNGTVMKQVATPTEHWTLVPNTATTDLMDMTLSGTKAIAVGNNTVLSSTDVNSTTWSVASPSTLNPPKQVAYNGTTAYITTTTGTLQSSTTPFTTWSTPVEVVAGAVYNDVALNGSNKLLVGKDGTSANTSNSTWAAGKVVFPILNVSQTITGTATAFVAGENGAIFKTTDSGLNWELMGAIEEDITAMLFSDANNAVLGTASGKLYSYDYNTFAGFLSPLNITSDLGVSVPIRDLYTSGKVDYLVSTGGKVYTRDDTYGNGYWQASTPATPSDLNTVFAMEERIAYAAGKAGTIIKSTDRGLTWTKLTKTDNTNWTSQELSDIYFTDYLTGYAIGKNGTLLKTINGGETWLDKSNQWSDDANLINLTFINKNKGIIVGSTVGQLDDYSNLYSSRFWYDELGRLIVSQNAKQFMNSNYSYTIYDVLGRREEVGEATTLDNVEPKHDLSGQVLQSDFATWLAITSKAQVTKTFYDKGATDLGLNTTITQDNLRTRVSATAYYDQRPTTGIWNSYQHASYYSYDIHGNVKTLVQHTPSLAAHGDEQYKQIDYSYDLISGKVNQVNYQAGKADQFLHRYEYDADNRITEVYTSKDGELWDKDAKYFYYRHGPLARTELGDQQVQGLDYAYTLQGWIKGVNSDALLPANDQGLDASTGSNGWFGKDAFSYSLGYYSGDYKAIGTASGFLASTAGTPMETARKSLFNGNISQMVTTISNPTSGIALPQLTNYTYDQLNRIKTMQAYRNFDATTNAWTSTVGDDQSYKTTMSYDANGNILTMTRNGLSTQNLLMDNFTYKYETIANGYLKNTNKLRQVTDGENSSNYATDIDNQVAENYNYDAIGNLVKDKQEEIATLEWTIQNKLKTLTRTAGSTKPDLEFHYDAKGDRVAKVVKPRDVNGVRPSSEWTTTHYVRDATGNTMAIYDELGTELKLKERYVYGSGHLGTDKEELVLGIASTPTSIFNRTLGNKQYFLTDHRGNINVVVKDLKVPSSTIYTPVIESATDYGVWGDELVGRSFFSDKAREGFGGHQKDNDISGSGNSYDFQGYGYDPRLGRRKGLDPLASNFPSESPYSFVGNSPLLFVDKDGDKKTWYVTIITKDGKEIYIQFTNEKQVKKDISGYTHLFYFDERVHPVYADYDLKQNITIDLSKEKTIITYGKEEKTGITKSWLSKLFSEGNEEMSQNGGINFTMKDSKKGTKMNSKVNVDEVDITDLMTYADKGAHFGPNGIPRLSAKELHEFTDVVVDLVDEVREVVKDNTAYDKPESQNVKVCTACGDTVSADEPAGNHKEFSPTFKKK